MSGSLCWFSTTSGAYRCCCAAGAIYGLGFGGATIGFRPGASVGLGIVTVTVGFFGFLAVVVVVVSL